MTTSTCSDSFSDCKCGPGLFFDQSDCICCPPGTYNNAYDNVGESDCLPCPSGYISEECSRECIQLPSNSPVATPTRTPTRTPT